MAVPVGGRVGIIRDPERMGIATEGAVGVPMVVLAAAATLLLMDMLLLPLRERKEEKSLEVWAMAPAPMLPLAGLAFCMNGKVDEDGPVDPAPSTLLPDTPELPIMAFEIPPFTGVPAESPTNAEPWTSCFSRAESRPAPMPESPCCLPEHTCRSWVVLLLGGWIALSGCCSKLLLLSPPRDDVLVP